MTCLEIEGDFSVILLKDFDSLSQIQLHSKKSKEKCHFLELELRFLSALWGKKGHYVGGLIWQYFILVCAVLFICDPQSTKDIF